MTTPGQPAAEAGAPIVFDVTVRLDDAIALHLRMLKSRPIAAGQLRRAIVTICVYPLFLVLCACGGLAIAWLQDGRKEPFAAVLRSAIENDFGSFALLIGVATALVAAAFLLRRTLVKRRLRRILRRAVMERPDVDPADPTLAYPAHVVFDAAGVESQSEAGVVRLSWKMLRTWSEEDGCIFLLGDAMSGFCIPMADTAPALHDAVRTFLDARLQRQAAR